MQLGEGRACAPATDDALAHGVIGVPTIRVGEQPLLGRRSARRGRRGYPLTSAAHGARSCRIERRRPRTARRTARPPSTRCPTRETCRAVLSKMMLIRHFEERAGEMYAKAKIGGFLHLCIGEEATVVGADPGDARERLPALHLPRARPGAGARHAPQRGDGRAVRTRGRLLEGARRLDAPVRHRAPLPRRLRDRGRQPAAGHRRRARSATTRAPTTPWSACSATAPPTRAPSASR